MKQCLFIFLFLSSFASYGQAKPPVYSTHIRTADSLFQTKQYLPAAHIYSAAFAGFNWKGFVTDRYKAARAWSLAGVPDSAFFQLEKIVYRGNFEDDLALQSDTAFHSLHTDMRWTALIKFIQRIDDACFDAQLYQLIDSLEKADQKWRHLATELQNAPVVDTLQVKQVTRLYNLTDSLNYYLLQSILDTYGFPNYDLVGKTGTHRFWLLIQHQDQHPAFQERVLQLMEKEVAARQASPEDYAYLLDRVMKNTGRPQVYGTQMVLNQANTSYEPYLVVDPVHLNQRRKSMGLGTIEAYIEAMNQHYHGTLKK